MSRSGKRSAGLLMFRRRPGDVQGGGEALEVFLVHPGGPSFVRKDEGAWSIPKGEFESGEDLLRTAIREFQEEVGLPPDPVSPYLELGTVTQKGGKIVHAWAFETRRTGPIDVRSNSFEMEWPPGSGRRAAFPEVDKGEFFPPDEARRKMNPAQRDFVDRLIERLAGR